MGRKPCYLAVLCVLSLFLVACSCAIQAEAINRAQMLHEAVVFGEDQALSLAEMEDLAEEVTDEEKDTLEALQHFHGAEDFFSGRNEFLEEKAKEHEFAEVARIAANAVLNKLRGHYAEPEAQ